MRIKEYESFLNKKKRQIISSGFEAGELNEKMFKWQKDVVRWACKKGRAALFEDCGLGKTLQQLEWGKQVVERTDTPVLIVAPLAVSRQTRREAEKFGYEINICRNQNEIKSGMNITNYEIVSRFNPDTFSGVVLDESSILKHSEGITSNLITEMFLRTPYKLSCTATPAPNDFMELGTQAEFLGIMSCAEMLSEFYVHDGGNTSKWRLKGHAERKYWEWVASWALVMTKPSDLGYSDEGYKLPGLKIINHVTKSEPKEESDGQLSIICGVAKTLTERRRARKRSLTERCKIAAELIADDPNSQWIVWCNLNAESAELARVIPDSIEVKGKDSANFKEKIFEEFSEGSVRYLITKPSIAGFGLNWQSCHNIIFVGLSDSYEMIYQAIRRCYRFGQEQEVNVNIITSEEEGAVKENIERKERQSQKFISEMVKYTKSSLKNEMNEYRNDDKEYTPRKTMILPTWIT